MQLAMVPTYAIVPPCVSEGEPRYRMWNNASKHRPVDRNGKASFMDASSRPVCPFTCTSWRSMLLSAGDALWPKLYVCACIYIDRERDYDYINYICFFLAVWPREPMNFRCLWTGKVRCQAGEVREFSVLAMRNNKDNQLLRQPICHDKTEENFYRARQHFETGSSTMARNPEILGRRAGHRLFMPLQL